MVDEADWGHAAEFISSAGFVLRVYNKVVTGTFCTDWALPPLPSSRHCCHLAFISDNYCRRPTRKLIQFFGLPLVGLV